VLSELGCVTQRRALLGVLLLMYHQDSCSGDSGEVQHFSKANSSKNCNCRALDLKTDLYLLLIGTRGGLHSTQQKGKILSLRHECNETLDPVPLITVALVDAAFLS